MREIKFRAWDYQKNSWAKESDVLPSMGLTFGINDFFIKDGHEIDRWEFCQFTGLKDKNSKEIYEGDIINPLSETETKYSKKRRIAYIVSFKNGSFTAQGYNGELVIEPNLYDIIHRGFEIIGNIYENPELLK